MENCNSVCPYTTLFSRVFPFKEMSSTAPCSSFAPRILPPAATVKNVCWYYYCSLGQAQTLFSSEDLKENKLNWIKCQNVLIWLIYLILIYYSRPLALFMLIFMFFSPIYFMFLSHRQSACLCWSVTETSTSLSICSHSCDYSFMSAGVISALQEANIYNLDF